MAKSHLRLVTPGTEKRTVTPAATQCDLRTREYLTETEVERLMERPRGTVGVTGTPG